MTQSGYESSGYYLNNEQIVFNNWNLRINAMDTNCSSITGPLAAFELYSNKKADVFLGPVCDYVLAPVARYAGRWGLPVLTPGGHASSFKIKDDHFPTLTRLLGGYSHVGAAMKIILEHFNWNKIGLLFHNHARESGKGNSDCHFTLGAIFAAMKQTDAFHRSFDENEFSDEKLTVDKIVEDDEENIKSRQKRIVENSDTIEDLSDRILNKRSVNDSSGADCVNYTNCNSNSEKRMALYRELLGTLSKSAKIAVLCASPNTIREIMLAADDLNMVGSGEYVFFNIELYTSMTSASLKPWYNPQDSDENNVRARRAYEALLTVTAQTPDDQQYREFSQQVKSLSKSKYNYTFNEQEPLSTFVTAFYDAVTLYARALNASLADNRTTDGGGTEPNYEILGRPLNGSDITRRMRNAKFKGITGDVIIDSNGDRLSDYSLLDMDPETGMFEVVANYIASSRVLEFVPGKKIHWPGNRLNPPLDSPVCGFDMSLCPDNSLPGYAILSIVLSFVLFIVLIGAVLLYKRYRDEADLLSMSWMVDHRQIIPISSVSSRHPTRGSCMTLTAAVNNPDVLNNCADPLYGNNSGNPATAGGMPRRGSQITTYSLDLFAAKNQNSGRQLFCKVAVYKGVRVALKSLPPVKTKIEITRQLKIELRNLKHLSHDHLTRFYGACLDPPEGPGLLLTEYCPRGSLQDILENCQLELDWMFRISLMQDIVRGMCYLHNSDIKSHGTLKSSNCVVDSRFVLKITDFGLHALRSPGSNCLDNSSGEEKKTKTDGESHSRRYKNKTVNSYKWRNKNYRRNSVASNSSKWWSSRQERSSRWWKDKSGVTDIEDTLSASTPRHHNGSLSTDYETSYYDDRFNKESHVYWKQFLWTAPELLRMDSSKRPPAGTQKGDVYSFAIIVHEIVTRNGAFYRDDDMTPKEIVEGVRRGPKTSSLGSSPGSPNPLGGSVSPNSAVLYHNHNSGASGGHGPNALQQRPQQAGGALVRPTIVEGTEQQLTEIMNHCWSEDPNHRPDFNSLKSTVRRLNKDQESGNILDNLLSRMEQYANNLETLVEERTRDYFEEKRKCEELLYQLLPKTVASQLISGGAVAAETYDEVTVYFSDIVGFTKMSAESTPMQVVDLLNDLYSCFDSIIENFDVYKVETIGDAYMVVSGLPTRNGSRHASEIARMALALLGAVDKFTIRHRRDEKLLLRIGIHTGPCVAGVVGRVMPRYCLFGDTVNTASRMESHGEPLKIHVSPFTKRLLDIMGGFLLQERGEVSMKGKPPMITYWLLGEAPIPPSTDTSIQNATSEKTVLENIDVKDSKSDLENPQDICDLEFFTKDDFCEVEIHDETSTKHKNKCVRFPGLATPEIVCSGPGEEDFKFDKNLARVNKTEKIRSYSANYEPTKISQSRKDFFEPKSAEDLKNVNFTTQGDWNKNPHDPNRPKSEPISIPNCDQNKQNLDGNITPKKFTSPKHLNFENLELQNINSQKYNDTGQNFDEHKGACCEDEKSLAGNEGERIFSETHSILKNKLSLNNNNNNLRKTQQHVKDESAMPLLDK
ncbi:atrial natriuretic peptide receptor 1-like isoform X2 [Ctenocephalides felis]|uniref:atrial natriuretic peptide receptor 1-like isoform X2 n=1 Tax=Ctenocephalides felis TaxID=7515 RepID=UPI000E6E4BF6|nr:atrial natriuretic peptide receptor 1-like isoform X2 [Ctenocephalides felis]